MSDNREFWEAADKLLSSGKIIIDRPRGSRHPKYRDTVYELDYGYIDGTTSSDGGGVDVWRGTSGSNTVDAVIVTLDLGKRDSEIKLIVGCTESEIDLVYEFHNRTELMKGLLIKR